MRHPFPVSALLLSALCFGCRAAPAAPGAQALFNGHDLSGWHADVPEADGNPNIKPSFRVKGGHLISMGEPGGHLITDAVYADYHLTVEYRWPGTPGNCGVLAHASKPRRLYGMYPQSIECQMNHGTAGDFWCIGEDIRVDNEAKRRGTPDRKKWGGEANQARRILNLGNFERPVGEWNRMDIECKGRDIKIWLNGRLANHGTDCTADHGRIALQAEGAQCEFRRVELTKLK